ncbi:hypothetical protein OIU74_001686 [Salix koriyanagi]|uniref:Uncharacterized protein n=1 Tax=Salix koriyanagi TaxID=2511006 RepID=A0A9Q0X1W2_9ROSI|nr:hypothetical protein OIU74_001686 [Salix koriyanagi]
MHEFSILLKREQSRLQLTPQFRKSFPGLLSFYHFSSQHWEDCYLGMTLGPLLVLPYPCSHLSLAGYHGSTFLLFSLVLWLVVLFMELFLVPSLSIQFQIFWEGGGN